MAWKRKEAARYSHVVLGRLKFGVRLFYKTSSKTGGHWHWQSIEQSKYMVDDWIYGLCPAVLFNTPTVRQIGVEKWRTLFAPQILVSQDQARRQRGSMIERDIHSAGSRFFSIVNVDEVQTSLYDD